MLLGTEVGTPRVAQREVADVDEATFAVHPDLGLVVPPERKAERMRWTTSRPEGGWQC